MIQLKDVTIYFNRGSANEVLCLENIDLDVPSGDFVTIIGSNGAGKSTLLNCISGTHMPDAGQIHINETDITRWPEHQRAQYIGRVFQDPLMGTSASLTIEQNLALAGKRASSRGLRIGVKKRDRDVFRQKLTILGLGLEDRLHDRVGLLSGGQRQALTMVMATLVRPKVLLLDEHTAALDPKTAHQISHLTQEIVEQMELTTLMVTHNMNQALMFGNRIIMLHQGHIIMDVRGTEKETLTVNGLLSRFYEAQGEEFSSDRVLLSRP